jgi:hypothetical protein
VIKAAALLALLLVACTANPGVAPSPSPVATPAPSATAKPSPTPRPTTPPSATPEPRTAYSPDDEQLAALIRAGTDEAIPQLFVLNDMDPQKLEDLFLPLQEWIDGQRAGVEAYTPSSCTAEAVALFIDGMNQYDDIREKFLEWRDWGAVGHAFPVGAPGAAIRTFEAALAELEETCPA